jgi:hypothetical protein
MCLLWSCLSPPSKASNGNCHFAQVSWLRAPLGELLYRITSKPARLVSWASCDREVGEQSLISATVILKCCVKGSRTTGWKLEQRPSWFQQPARLEGALGRCLLLLGPHPHLHLGPASQVFHPSIVALATVARRNPNSSSSQTDHGKIHILIYNISREWKWWRSVIHETCCWGNCSNIFTVACYLYSCRYYYSNMHISALGICPYKISVCCKIATVVGLVQYVSDHQAVRGPHLFFHSLLMCLTTM